MKTPVEVINVWCGFEDLEEILPEFQAELLITLELGYLIILIFV